MKLAGPVRPAFFLYHSLWAALDLLFPPTCGGCSRPGSRWCSDCQEKVKLIKGQVCPLCGEPQSEDAICKSCIDSPPAYQMLRSSTEFGGPLREAMHRLKYKQDLGLGESLSKHLIELYNHLKWETDYVVPVPLSEQRMRERGYNQAGLLARPLAYAIQTPYRPDILERSRETRSQVGLSARERQQNVADAFTSSPEQVRGKVILVVDDVTTTGSTINSCAQAFCRAGVSAVFGITLARAVLQTHNDDQPESSHINGG
jgi:ComF family protein